MHLEPSPAAEAPWAPATRQPMALRYGARRRRRNAVAYGKHGKVLRWMIVRLMVDYDWKAAQIARHLSFQGRFRTISVATIRRIVKIWRETGDVATPREGTRRRQGSMLPQHWQELRRALHDAPDLFLDEMKTVLWLAFDVRYSIGVILGTMKRHGYTRRVLKQRGPTTRHTPATAYTSIAAA